MHITLENNFDKKEKKETKECEREKKPYGAETQFFSLLLQSIGTNASFN